MKKIIETLDQWIENPNRKYADGLALFEACGTETQKKEYLPYFKSSDSDEQTQFSQPMTILTNKLVAVKQMMQVSPETFKDVQLPIKKENAVDNAAIEKKEAEINALRETIEELSAKLENTEDDNSDLQDELDDKEADLEELQAELEELKKQRGLQIVAVNDLPKNIKKLYDRNREITPLMASIHSEIANESTSEEKRKELVAQLVALDDERRQNWHAIDDWAQGKDVKIEDLEENPKYDPDPILAGLQMARRIERLKENIQRSKASAEKGKTEVIRDNAEKRVLEYEAELKALEERIGKSGPTDDENGKTDPKGDEKGKQDNVE